MSQSETETEHERKVREFWAKKFDLSTWVQLILRMIMNRLPYEPTAVLVSKRHLQQESFRFMT